MLRFSPGVVALHLALSLLAGSSAGATGVDVEDIQAAVMNGDQGFLEQALARMRSETAGSSSSSQDLYVRAYVAWRLSYFHPRESELSQELLEDAQRDLERVLKVEPENADALVLLASVNGSRITGWWSALRRGRRSLKSYERALELEPDNPRVVMLVGISRLFRPERFGGGLDRAREELEQARELFDRQAPGQAWPDWGHPEVLAWLGQVALRAGDLQAARERYREALVLESDYDWVRRSLLPVLEERLRTAALAPPAEVEGRGESALLAVAATSSGAQLRP